MSEAKFTKGEWIVDFNGDVGVGMGSETIASMSDMECSYIKEDNVHNTFLIAAAPEMYEEIESEIEFLKDLREEFHTVYSLTLIDERIADKVNLLAKARGEK